MVGAQGVCGGARRRAGQRQIPRPMRTVVARGVDRLLRCDRVGGGAVVVLGQGRAIGHILFRHQPVVRRQSPAAVVEGDHSVGRFCRPCDALFHGGLLSLFMPNWYLAHLMHHPNRWRSDTLQFWLSNTLDSGAFRGAQAQWDKMTVPMLSVGNWTGMGLHLRGNTEAFMRAATPHKKLRIHAGTHVHPFYSEEGRGDQLRFFDYWLKGIDNGVMQEPPVKLAIRKGRDEAEWRFEHEWPLARTRWTKFYFELSPPAPGRSSTAGRRAEA